MSRRKKRMSRYLTPPPIEIALAKYEMPPMPTTMPALEWWRLRIATLGLHPRAFVPFNEAIGLHVGLVSKA